MKQILLTLTCAVLFSVSTAAEEVIATNAWTAAFARAAGATEVQQLAPSGMRHPPEYELRPRDIVAIRDARFIVYAGYEQMVGRLREASGTEAELVQIRTGYARAVLRESIGRLAAILGDPTAADAGIAALEGEIEAWSAELLDHPVSGRPVVVHFHQQDLARDLGLNVVSVFGPAPLEAREIARLAGLSPVLIIDNGHNPIAAPLAESASAPVVEFINFPGSSDTSSLMDVIRRNRAVLRDLLSGVVY